LPVVVGAVRLQRGIGPPLGDDQLAGFGHLIGLVACVIGGEGA
jgi:hypothetical protein